MSDLSDAAPPQPATRFVGWSVVNEAGDGCFGTYDQWHAAHESAEKMRGYGYAVRVEERRMPDERAQIREALSIGPDASHDDVMWAIGLLVERAGTPSGEPSPGHLVRTITRVDGQGDMYGPYRPCPTCGGPDNA